MRTLLAVLSLVILALGFPEASLAQLQLSRLFQDGMIVQRGVEVPVWGWTDADAEVTITLDGTDTFTGQADASGWFTVRLDAMEAGGPHTLVATSAGSEIRIEDVLVGDVWIASGQSNMEWPLQNAASGAEAVAAADDASIRQFKVPKALADEPADRLPANSDWTPATSAHAGNFTAVGYFFARDLREHVDVPVGILNVSYGGSRIETWMSDEMLGYDEQDRTLANGEPERQPTVAFNAMLHPLLPFPVKGILWYQGESNGDSMEDALAYGEQFRTMITGWRDLLEQGVLPFLWVQLPNYGTPTTPETDARPPTWDAWPQLRAGQSSALSLPNTGEAVTIDVGGEDIHPRRKEPVGQRLALVARHVAYGEDLVYSGPRYASNRLREDGSVAVGFDHVDGGLVAAGAEAVGAFTVAGEDGAFYWADAVIEGDSVIVSSEQVPEPVTLRYAWMYNPAGANLYNEAELPAAPFQTAVNPGFKIGAFGATRTAIEPGQSTVLSWQVFNAASVTLDGEAVDAEGSRTVSPTETTTYTLEAVNSEDETDVLTAQVTIEVLDPDEINRALNKPATASTYETCCGLDRVPAYAVDAVDTTRWSSAWSDGSGDTELDPMTDEDPGDEWIAVDFGQAIDVERVILDWEAAYGSAYDVELSYDGYRWHTVYEERAGDGGEDNVTFEEPQSGRFLRIHGLERATEFGYSLWEIAAYGDIAEQQPPSVTVGTTAGNVVSAEGTVTLTAAAEDSDGTVTKVTFFVDGEELSTDEEAPFEASWTPGKARRYAVTALATDDSGLAVQSAPLTIFGDNGTLTRYEAEDAATTGQANALTAGAASGGEYLELRDAWTLTFSGVEVPAAGTYLLSIGYQLTFESPKAQYLVVNGDTVETVEFTAPDASVWLQRGTEVKLNAGPNEIALHGFWNWMSVDFIAVSDEALALSSVGVPERTQAVVLRPNYPNPFNPSTVIRYELPQASHVRLDVFDVTGRRVAVLADEHQRGGPHAIGFYARGLASGVYVYRLQAAVDGIMTTQARRMLLVR